MSSSSFLLVNTDTVKGRRITLKVASVQYNRKQILVTMVTIVLLCSVEISHNFNLDSFWLSWLQSPVLASNGCYLLHNWQEGQPLSSNK